MALLSRRESHTARAVIDHFDAAKPFPPAAAPSTLLCDNLKQVLRARRPLSSSLLSLFCHTHTRAAMIRVGNTRRSFHIFTSETPKIFVVASNKLFMPNIK